MSEAEQIDNSASTGGEGPGASHNEEAAVGGEESASTPNDEPSTTEASSSSVPTAGVPLPVSVSSCHVVLSLEPTANVGRSDGR